MGVRIEGSEAIGYRVVDDVVGPLTARLRTREAAEAVADKHSGNSKPKPSRAEKPSN